MKLWRLFNRQKIRGIDRVLFRKIASHLLETRGHEHYELGVHLVNAVEMARINETFLNHTGSTDVITFDHQESPDDPALHGEIFICIEDAIAQAREFSATWPTEIVRYFVHGVLHLEGHDDLEPAARRRMKRAENKLVKELSFHFPLGRLAVTKNGTGRK